MNNIFRTILKWYFRMNNFNADVQAMEGKIVAGTLKIY
jgi:hypothetical protein